MKARGSVMVQMPLIISLVFLKRLWQMVAAEPACVENRIMKAEPVFGADRGVGDVSGGVTGVRSHSGGDTRRDGVASGALAPGGCVCCSARRA